MSYIVVINSKPSFEEYLPIAKKLGLKICFLASFENISQVNKENFEHVASVEIFNEQSILGALASLGIQNKIRLFWTMSAFHVAICHELNEKYLGNSKFSLELANKTQNKFLLRKSLENTCFNPMYYVLNVREKSKNPFGNQPCVLKPFLGYSSIGVELVRQASEFDKAFLRSASVLGEIDSKMLRLDLNETSPNEHLLCEEFVQGSEYSLEIFGTNGILQCLSICQKSPMKEPYFEEITYQMPAMLNSIELARISSAGCSIMSALGMKSGIAHLEVIVNEDGIYALDVGLRIGGSGLTQMLMKHSSGRNLMEACLLEALDLDPTSALEERTQ